MVKRDALNDQISKYPAKLEELHNDIVLYTADLDNVARVNAAVAAREDMAALAAGDLTPRLRKLRAAINDMYVEAQEYVARTDGLDPETKAYMDLQTPRVRPSTAAQAPEPEIPQYNTANIKATNEVLESEVARLDPETQVAIGENETMSLKQMADENKAIDDALDSIGVCSYGGVD